VFIVFLKFTEQKVRARELMSGHNAWLNDGMERGLFLLAGGLQPQAGGCIIAHNIDRGGLDQLIAQDPFVEHKVVQADVFEISPSMVAEPLKFLLSPGERDH